MKQISLLRNFMLNIIVNSIAWGALLGLIIFFIAPVLAWFITGQWTWASFDNTSKGKILLSIPFAFVMAGGNTLVLWHERTDRPLKWKLVVWAVVFGILGGIGFGCVLVINNLLPVPAHTSLENSGSESTQTQKSESTGAGQIVLEPYKLPPPSILTEFELNRVESAKKEQSKKQNVPSSE